jgi:diguanylate cyclase (GGDEF)-like protein
MGATAAAKSRSSEEPVLLAPMLARAEEIQQQIQKLSGRDLQLWSIVVLVILVLTSGVLALVLPNLMWAQRVIHVDHSYLPQLFFGLISLVLLFNIYLLAQKRNLNTTRLALIRELVLNERLESLSLIDPLTQVLNRRAMNELIPREVARSNRLGSSLTFMALDLNGFASISSTFGALEGDRILVEFARILRTVFRGADVAFRQGGDEFLVMMPDTTEEQANAPVQRLLKEVDQWNLASKQGYELSFSWALAPYVAGSDAEDVLRAVDRKMYSKKHNLVPVF